MKGKPVSFILYNENCLDLLKRLEKNSVDSIVTDPPYGLSFMGKKWDYDVPSVEIWAECLRVLKPGGHLLAFAGTRTQHRMAVRIEDAGFEIRDMIAWVYGSGFPKSHDVSKAIDKQVDAERKVVGTKIGLPGYHLNPHDGGEALGHGLSSSTYETRLKSSQITAPATEAAKQWEGWGTALKPALEPITVARKPLIGTVAENVLEHGTGGLNIDGCRVGDNAGWSYPNGRGGSGWHGRESLAENLTEPMTATQGRWPANLIHDGSDEVIALAGEQARFFYCAKASKKDREDGNYHPTVKPTDLMRYLCRLITPPNGVILDPFMGSGSTGKAAMLEGFQFIGVELENEYVKIAKARIENVMKGTK
jgi:site-specific DNA-methyltransferase (adenine-specific)